MKTTIFTNKFLTVYHETSNPKAIVFDWSDFYWPLLSEVEEAHVKALSFAVNHDIKTYIAETSKCRQSQLRDEVQAWWPTFLPVIVDGGINKILTVPPTEFISKRCDKNWKSAVVNVMGIDCIDVPSLSEALKMA